MTAYGKNRTGTDCTGATLHSEAGNRKLRQLRQGIRLPASGLRIKNIVFNFPMPVEGGEVKELSLESETTVESIVLLSKLADDHIELEIDPLELEKVVDRVPPLTPKLSSTF